MGKQRKNSNYVTEKNTAAKQQMEQELIKKKRMKLIKNISIAAGTVIALAAVIVGIVFLAGGFDYRPEGTADVLIDIDGYGSLHVVLYGNDAPETVKHFLALVESGYYNGKTVFKLLDDIAYAGSTDASSAAGGIKGEFAANGYDNKISHKRGIISMARADGYDSAYGQFFIVRKNATKLDGEYAAFARVTDGMDVIDEIFKDLETDENGMITDKAPVINSISTHAHH